MIFNLTIEIKKTIRNKKDYNKFTIKNIKAGQTIENQKMCKFESSTIVNNY